MMNTDILFEFETSNYHTPENFRNLLIEVSTILATFKVVSESPLDVIHLDKGIIGLYCTIEFDGKIYKNDSLFSEYLKAHLTNHLDCQILNNGPRIYTKNHGLVQSIPTSTPTFFITN